MPSSSATYSRPIVVGHDGVEEFVNDGVLQRGEAQALAQERELAGRGIPYGFSRLVLPDEGERVETKHVAELGRTVYLVDST